MAIGFEPCGGHWIFLTSAFSGVMGIKTVLSTFKEFGSKQIDTSFKEFYRKGGQKIGQKLEGNAKPGNVFSDVRNYSIFAFY